MWLDLGKPSTSVFVLGGDLSHSNLPHDLLAFTFLLILACIFIGGSVSAELDALIRARYVM